MNPPNTAQIVKTRLLVKVFPSESLLSLSVTMGILNLKMENDGGWEIGIERKNITFNHEGVLWKKVLVLKTS